MNMVRRAAVVDIDCKKGMLTYIYCISLTGYMSRYVEICKELSKYDKEMFLVILSMPTLSFHSFLKVWFS